MPLQNTINNVGLIEWIDTTGTTQTIAPNKGYLANNAALLVFSLPATFPAGSVFEIAGVGAGGWRIIQGAGQSIKFGDKTSTVGTGGTLNSTHRSDSARIVCVTANTVWQVLGAVGNLDIV